VHDRTIKGKTFVFGNAGGLYKNAMTWWDHETFSIWSQPTGEALAGPLEGTRLEPLPFQLTTWDNWQEAHPKTLVMNNQVSRMGAFRQSFSENFLIGVTVAGEARGYPYQIVEEKRLIEEQLGDFPILIWAGSQDYRVFLRLVGGQELNFRWEEEGLVDEQTGSVWDPRLGLARKGEYQGQALQQLPSFSIFESSWEDFYPEGDIYKP